MGDRVLSYIYNYSFNLQTGTTKVFTVEIDEQSLELISNDSGNSPDWTLLDHHKCSNCTLNSAEHTYCPVAKEIAGVVETFKSVAASAQAVISVDNEERSYRKKCAVQEGLSSLFGLIMTTCGCPVMQKLRPLVRFHLPFSSLEETEYRAISMYLVGQYFRMKEGKHADWEMTGLNEIYDGVRIVNKTLYKRIRAVTYEDASVNALTILDVFAHTTTFSIENNKFEELETVFSEYINSNQNQT